MSQGYVGLAEGNPLRNSWPCWGSGSARVAGGVISWKGGAFWCSWSDWSEDENPPKNDVGRCWFVVPGAWLGSIVYSCWNFNELWFQHLWRAVISWDHDDGQDLVSRDQCAPWRLVTCTVIQCIVTPKKKDRKVNYHKWSLFLYRNLLVNIFWGILCPHYWKQSLNSLADLLLRAALVPGGRSFGRSRGKSGSLYSQHHEVGVNEAVRESRAVSNKNLPNCGIRN